MRENRYRGKSVDNGNWIYGSLVTVDSYYGDDWNGAYILPKVLDYAQNFDRNAAEVIAETVGQFTGLKDKNGVDVYDGDILLVGENTMPCELTVRWNNYLYGFDTTTKQNNGIDLYVVDQDNDFKVIGNIHEVSK